MTINDLDAAYTRFCEITNLSDNNKWTDIKYMAYLDIGWGFIACLIGNKDMNIFMQTISQKTESRIENLLNQNSGTLYKAALIKHRWNLSWCLIKYSIFELYVSMRIIWRTH
jgi:hypothetical protein